MAARKPSITRTRRTKKTPEPEATAQQDTGDDISTLDIIEVHLRNTTTHFGNIATVLNTRLEEIVNLLTERNAPGPDNTVLDGFVAKLAAIEAKFNQIPVSLDLSPIIKRLDALEKAVNAPATPGEVAEIVEPAKRRGRPPKDQTAGYQQVIADQGKEQKSAPKTEIVHCKHIGTLENLQRPGLARCTVCGAIVDVEPPKVASVDLSPGSVAKPVMAPPAPAAQQTVAVPAPAPAANNGASKIPSADDVRAVAITFAGKHGKPALADALKEFGATNLSTLPEENRAGLMAKLQAGI